MTELAAAAKVAGLIDHALLQLARPDLPAREAVADLVRRFPRAFGAKDGTAGIALPRPVRLVPKKPVAEMSAQEVDEYQRALVAHSAIAPQVAAERARFAKIAGVKQ